MKYSTEPHNSIHKMPRLQLKAWNITCLIPIKNRDDQQVPRKRDDRL